MSCAATFALGILQRDYAYRELVGSSRAGVSPFYTYNSTEKWDTDLLAKPWTISRKAESSCWAAWSRMGLPETECESS